MKTHSSRDFIPVLAIQNAFITTDSLIRERKRLKIACLSPEAPGIIPNQPTAFMDDYVTLLQKPGINLKKTAKEGKIPPKALRAASIRSTSIKGGDYDSRGQVGECDRKGMKLSMKLNLSKKGRAREHKIVERYTDLADAWVRKHLSHVLGWYITHFDVSTVQGRLKKNGYKERVIYGSIQEELYPIMDLESPEKLTQVM
ncbi:hypothetical protein BT96DRAFT_1007239 [Gymnopus androsaceus JB14]|uniref:Uncharacterized protein n=1 Tax=Gymnopus androsaceus JB14 TaxID=1447944 RepID=A0A6A4GIP7_9AGAR|nr:hypothetical protein BT96DRAFT_1007239 [Gymnopus androsaceus JB14]